MYTVVEFQTIEIYTPQGHIDLTLKATVLSRAQHKYFKTE